jgi:hypothetical protein
MVCETSLIAVALAHERVWHSPLSCTLSAQSPHVVYPSIAMRIAATTEVVDDPSNVPASVRVVKSDLYERER